MIIGKVVGNLWATRKEESLNGLKLLIIKPMGSEKETIVAVDKIGAGNGDRVLIACGSSARNVLDRKDTPVDATVVGIIDELEIDDL